MGQGSAKAVLLLLLLQQQMVRLQSSAHPGALPTPAALPLLLAMASSLRSAAMSMSSFCVLLSTTASLSFNTTTCTQQQVGNVCDIAWPRLKQVQPLRDSANAGAAVTAALSLVLPLTLHLAATYSLTGQAQLQTQHSY
jgi:hypothetical protein